MLSDEKEAIERLDYFEPDDLVECAMYRDCVETIKNLIEKQQKEIEELEKVICRVRNLSSGVICYDEINGKKYLSPRKNFSKQRLYKDFYNIQLILKGNYIFLTNEDFIKEIKKGGDKNV